MLKVLMCIVATATIGFADYYRVEYRSGGYDYRDHHRGYDRHHHSHRDRYYDRRPYTTIENHYYIAPPRDNTYIRREVYNYDNRGYYEQRYEPRYERREYYHHDNNGISLGEAIVGGAIIYGIIEATK